jgi:hypothetical protein
MRGSHSRACWGCRLNWSPLKDPTRVFCLCWHHHHGCYDQGYISTRQILEAEMVWIENKQRPKPHPRDIELMQRVRRGQIPRVCVWTNDKGERLPTFEPNPPACALDIRRSVAALKAHATRWIKRAENAPLYARFGSLRGRDIGGQPRPVPKPPVTCTGTKVISRSGPLL